MKFIKLIWLRFVKKWQNIPWDLLACPFDLIGELQVQGETPSH